MNVNNEILRWSFVISESEFLTKYDQLPWSLPDPFRYRSADLVTLSMPHLQLLNCSL